jgi:hypothetical protein
MTFFSLRNWLKPANRDAAADTARLTRGRPRRHGKRVALRLEELECRNLPSTLTVLNSADSGAGSLRDTIAAAHSGDQIVFDDSLQGQTITLTSGELAITKSLDIDGLGADQLTVSGNDASRVFRVTSGITVEIDDLTITHGRADKGGGIWDAGGTLSLCHDVFSDNQALGAPGSGAEGGGVFNQGGTLTVDDSTFSANVATGGLRLGATATAGQGGGLASGELGATATVSDTTFRDNLASGGAGAHGNSGSKGVGRGF